MRNRFPSVRLRIVLWAYRLAWWVGLPVILWHLRKRGRADPLYVAHLDERFGTCAPNPGAVWVHAVSLGEMRSAVPLIRALLDRGDRIVTTHFTPAGRREAQSVFAADIATGQVSVVWVPFEFGWTFRRFFRAFQPRYGLVMEIEIWPVMILAARRAGVPLLMCNAQFPSKSFARDRNGLRGELMRGFAGALVKSDLQRDRFAQVGVAPILVTGELRFDQPIPQAQVAAGVAARPKGRAIITIASAVEGEDSVYLGAIQSFTGNDRPLFVYVPRKPERFDDVYRLLVNAGLHVARRTDVFDKDLRGTLPNGIDVLLGDSLGEMYFYLALCDRVIVGGGFTAKGAHNIIEPLALKKPVIVGPEIWTIEYPAVEAIAAGVCTQVTTEKTLRDAITKPLDSANIESFFASHAGAVARTLRAIDGLTSR